MTGGRAHYGHVYGNIVLSDHAAGMLARFYGQ